MKFVEPWESCSKDSQYFVDELKKELHPTHILYEIKVTAIARRCDCDDVLFELSDFTHEYAVVHLTYSKETNPRFPLTELYKNMNAWVKQRMKPDCFDYQL